MFPVLFSVGPIVIYTYGFLLALGFLISLFLIFRFSLRKYLDEEKVFDAVFIAMFSGIVGARIFYIIEHFDKFGFVFWRWILVNSYPGLSLFGGLCIGFAVLLLMARSYKLPVNTILDMISIPLLVALMFGQLGAFFGGTMIGTPTKMPWGVIYYLTVKRHPIGLYAFIGSLIVLAAVSYLSAVYRGKKFYDGSLFYTFVLLETFVLFWVAFFKEDAIVIAEIYRIEQIAYVLIFLISLLFLYLVSKRSLRQDLSGIKSNISSLFRFKK